MRTTNAKANVKNIILNDYFELKAKKIAPNKKRHPFAWLTISNTQQQTLKKKNMNEMGEISKNVE